MKLKDSLRATVAATALITATLSATSCERREARPRSVPIALGDTVEGRLDGNDWTDVFTDRSYTDLYELRMQAGEQVAIELRSNDFDSYLSLLRGPGDQVIDNDDMADGTEDSRIVYTAETESRFFVAATSLGEGATGAYTLTIRTPTEEEVAGSSAPPPETPETPVGHKGSP